MYDLIGDIHGHAWIGHGSVTERKPESGGADDKPLRGRGSAILPGEKLNGRISIYRVEDSEFGAKRDAEKGKKRK